MWSATFSFASCGNNFILTSCHVLCARSWPSTCRWLPTRRSRARYPVTLALPYDAPRARFGRSFYRLVARYRYKEGGPAAVANFEAGVQGFTTRAFRGCGVVTSEPFEVSDGTFKLLEPNMLVPCMHIHFKADPFSVFVSQTWRPCRCSSALRRSASSTS